MSLPELEPQRSLFGAGNLAADLFEKTNRYRLFREKALPALVAGRQKLATLYCLDNGRPGIEPVLLAGVSLLQYMEKLPDREAVEAVKYHLGWKYAFDLPLTYAGFDPTSLVVFRKRLLGKETDGETPGGANMARLLFDEVLEALNKGGVVRSRGKQRLDSTHVLGNVAKMSRLELVRESIRLALIAVEDWEAKAEGWAVWRERYCESKIDWRAGTAELRKKMEQAGGDAAAILHWLTEKQEAAKWPKAVETLKRVFEEQYELSEGKAVASKAAEPSGCVKNPHDPDAQWAAKDKEKKTAWVGYKAQVMETVADDGRVCEPGEPTAQFITEVTTTEAIASDLDGMKRAMKTRTESGEEAPKELFVDAAYVTDDTLAEAQKEGRELTGPARSAPDNEGVLSVEQFDVSVERREAVCPAGKKSTQCSYIHDEHQGREYYRFEWGSQCDECPLKGKCTKSGSGRRIVAVEKHHDLLQARRKEMKTEEFKKKQKRRNAIEGTISELSRGYGMRRTRYRGLAKTRLANYLVGAACNLRRWFRLIGWRAKVAMASG
jgi:hypothetical protein